MSDLWDQLALTESKELKDFQPYIARREEQHLVQFLTALRSDFKGLRGTILHRSPLSSVDSVVHELIAEETRIKSHADKGFKTTYIPTPAPAVLAVSSNQSRQTSRVAHDECAFCKQKNHWKAQCPLLVNKGKSGQPQSGQQNRFGQQNFQPHSSGTPPWTSRPLQFAVAAVPPVDTESVGNMPPSTLDPKVFESFRQYLASNPTAMSAFMDQSGPSSSDTSSIPSSLWILDFGATHHMTPHLSSFVSLSQVSSIYVKSASDTSMLVEGVGSVFVSHITLPDVYYIPKLTLNLASVSQSGNWVFFSDSVCVIQDQHTQKVIGIGRRVGELYVLEVLKVSAVAASSIDLSSFCLSPLSYEFYLWHSRLGHVSVSRLNFLASSGVLGHLNSCDIFYCSGCKLAKFSALPFNKSMSCSTAPFDIIHSDVWGPAPVSTKGGSTYYVSFIDDYTRYTWVYLMKHRSDLFDIYSNFRALVKTQHSAVIQCFRCDLRGEYTSNDFTQLLASDGTIHQSSCTDTPHQNGVAERKHLHIVETARSLLLSAQKGYCCYDPVSQKLYVSRHVTFLEHIPFYSIPVTANNVTQSDLLHIDPFDEDIKARYSSMSHDPSAHDTPTSSEGASSPPVSETDPPIIEIEDPPPPPPLRRSSCPVKSTKLPDFSYSTYSGPFASFIASIHHLSEPESYKEAVLDPLWQNAMAEELTTLHQTHT
ncbi:uncharacterized protein LOC111912222 [Lactuca sativa]|uniref:uncharacterized protein LOC111912222 n=1 Tax=Lactuca sativa TaxID=4236 RepID=UPI0022AF7F6E|nr:uncharacterized protein LOC111912222 [Lactuca sativa]